jgi:hypothetical protein
MFFLLVANNPNHHTAIREKKPFEMPMFPPFLGSNEQRKSKKFSHPLPLSVFSHPSLLPPFFPPPPPFPPQSRARARKLTFPSFKTRREVTALHRKQLFLLLFFSVSSISLWNLKDRGAEVAEPRALVVLNHPAAAAGVRRRVLHQQQRVGPAVSGGSAQRDPGSHHLLLPLQRIVPRHDAQPHHLEKEKMETRVGRRRTERPYERRT